MCEGPSTISGPIPPHPMFLGNLDNLEDLHTSRSTNTLCEGPSKLSGPIINHFDNNNKATDYLVVPKVRNAGKVNCDVAKKGTGLGMLIAGCAIEPTIKRRGMFDNEQPKNYINSNAANIKKLMRKVKERQAATQVDTSKVNIDSTLFAPVAAPIKAFQKSEKYQNVQSKVKESLQVQPMAPREPHQFLRAHSRTGSLSCRPQSARQSPKTNDAKEETQKKFVSKDDFDFIKFNSSYSKSVVMKRAPSVENLKQVQQKMENDFEKYQQKIKGKVPTYLEKRNEEIKKAEIDYIKNLPDPDCPPGHRKLPDDEKRNTLNLLMESHKRMIAELNSLPIRNDTFRIQTTKNSYEKKLVELDEAIKIFSKPKVFVKIE